jgi:hypothetical protein
MARIDNFKFTYKFTGCAFMDIQICSFAFLFSRRIYLTHNYSLAIGHGGRERHKKYSSTVL